MPVYFFALSQCKTVNGFKAILIFILLHLFIYPASNGYNSYQDKDEGSIGGLKNPPKATKKLFYVSLLFDAIGLAMSLFIGWTFFVGVLAYMVVSRAYSSKLIRLKKYPILGFLAVFIFQGAVSFVTIYCGISGSELSAVLNSDLIYPVIASSFLIGGVYPLTQIYQHKQDTKSGDKTLSILLGYKGTFLFSLFLFLIANVILYFYFRQLNSIQSFYLLQAFLFPVMLFFLNWMRKVFNHIEHASFENTMMMNTLASLMLNICFLLLFIIR
jgi:1,4-dihydroxy-2-naphthoate octaprenyltransferase